MKNIHYRNIGLILLLALGLFSCKSYKNESKQEISNLKSVVIDEAVKAYFNPNDSIQVIPNQQGNWILYLSQSPTSPTNPNNSINFFVYNNINEKVIYKNKIDNAKISWIDNTQLKLTQYYGVIKTPTSSNVKNFIIDIQNNSIKEIKNQEIKD